MVASDLDTGAVLSTLLESVPSGVLAFDAEGQLSLASAPLASLLGLDQDQLRQLRDFDTVVDLLAPRFSDPDVVAARWRQHFAGGEASWDELELLTPARKILERFGRPIFDSSRNSTGDSNARRLGWIEVEVYREVTGQRLMERKLFQNERLVALGQLVSSVAHEINNPLTTIYGYAQLMLSRREAGRGGEPQYILQEAERASRIVRNLLLFARGARVERTAVNLNELIQRAMALRTYELSLTGIRLHLNLDPDLAPILADAAQVQQVVLNLVNNAEQALDPHRGQSRIWLRTRRLSAERVALDVTDDGPGIAPELIQHIFDPFFTTKPPGVGTGIGLSIVRGILCTTMAGKFPCKVTRGTAPCSPRSLWLPARLQPKRCSLPAGTISPRRILVVEDEPTVAHLVADVLAEEGCAVDTMLDSRAGLDLIRRRPYDLLICDLRMPHFDGASLYRELLRMESPLAQHLVFITGDVLLPSTIEFLESCKVPCLAKPFLVDDLKELVRETLAGSPVAAAAEAGQGAG